MSMDRHSQVRLAHASGVVWILLAPACALCTYTGFWATLVGIGGFGLLDAALSLHGWALLLAPTALAPLWVGYRFHRRRSSLVLGTVGVAGLLFHLVLDIGGATRPVILVYDTAFRFSARGGAALLIVGLGINAIALARWSSRRRAIWSSPSPKAEPDAARRIRHSPLLRSRSSEIQARKRARGGVL